jgi:hypothetical protein
MKNLNTESEIIGTGGAFSMFVSESGKVHVFYATEDTAYYAYKMPGSTWQKIPMVFPDTLKGYPISSDIVVDNDGYVHIIYSRSIHYSYHLKWSYQLIHFTNRGGQWTGKTIGINNLGYWSISMDINSSNEIHMFYQAVWGMACPGPFYYMNYKSGEWSIPKLFEGNGYDRISMALDNTGIAHTVYIKVNEGPVYRKSSDTEISGWEAPIPCPSWHAAQLEGMVVDIDVGNNNAPYIIYPGNKVKNLESINYADLSNGIWDWNELEHGVTMSGPNAITVDPGGTKHVAYFSKKNTALIYKKLVDSDWTALNLGFLWNEGSIDMGSDNIGNVNILYSEYVGGEIKFISLETGHISHLQITPDSLNFGQVKKNSSKTLDLLLTNPASSPVTVDSINIDDSNFTISFDPVTLASGEKDTVSVEFHPVEDVKINTDLTIYYDDTLKSYRSVTVTASSILPVLKVIPDPVPFGAVNINEQLIKNIVIKNTGSADLNITDVYVRYELYGYVIPSDFNLEGAGRSSIAPGDTCIIQVSFTPQKNGSQTSFLHILSNDFEEPHKEIELTGRTTTTVIQPEFYSVDFGYQDLNTTVTKKLKLYNVGDLDLNISSIELTSDVFSYNNNCSTILPGDSCEMEISFTPAQNIDYSATMKIYSNSDYRNPLEIPLSGNVCLRELTLTPENINFGSHHISDKDAMAILTLSNDGEYDINVSPITITGPSSYEFRHSGFTGVINPDSSIVDTVWFSPVFEGNKKAFLHISSNDSYYPEIDIQLQGEALLPAAEYSMSGKIFNEDGSEGITKGIVEIYKEGSFDNSASYQIEGTNDYTFTHIAEGNYTVKYTPDPQQYPDKLPTYIGEALTLTEATFVLVNQDLSLQNINVLNKTSGGSDDGKIKGILQ